MSYVVSGLVLLASFIALLAGLAWNDRHCVDSGGTVVVIHEHQAKGTMNHTECRRPERIT